VRCCFRQAWARGDVADLLAVATHPCPGRALQTDERCHRERYALREDREAEETDRATRFSTSDPEITATIRQAVEDLSNLRMRAHVEPGFLDLGTGGEQTSWEGARATTGCPRLAFLGSLPCSVATRSRCLFKHFRPRIVLLRGACARWAFSRRLDVTMIATCSLERLNTSYVGRTRHARTHTSRPLLRQPRRYPLYVLCAAETWAWHGSRAKLDALRPRIEAALGWIERHGDSMATGSLNIRRAPSADTSIRLEGRRRRDRSR